jgi:galactoside O-acetyltransferase
VDSGHLAVHPRPVPNPFDPGYYVSEQLRAFGFKAVGENVGVAKNCTIVGVGNISFEDDIRIDGGTCIVATTGSLHFLGRNHVGGQCHFCVAADLTFGEFAGCSQGARIYTANDDYSGRRMTGPMVPADLRGARIAPIFLGRHAVIGAGSVLLPECHVPEGCAVGALSLVNRPLRPWGIYHGNPVRQIAERRRDVEQLEDVLKLRLLPTQSGCA